MNAVSSTAGTKKSPSDNCNSHYTSRQISRHALTTVCLCGNMVPAELRLLNGIVEDSCEGEIFLNLITDSFMRLHPLGTGDRQLVSVLEAILTLSYSNTGMKIFLN